MRCDLPASLRPFYSLASWITKGEHQGINDAQKRRVAGLGDSRGNAPREAQKARSLRGEAAPKLGVSVFVIADIWPASAELSPVKPPSRFRCKPSALDVVDLSFERQIKGLWNVLGVGKHKYAYGKASFRSIG